MNKKEIFKRYENYRTLKGTVDTERHFSVIKEFFMFLELSNPDYLNISSSVIEEYRGYLLKDERKLTHGSVNNKMSILKGFYNFLFKRKLIIDNPFSGFKGLKTGRQIPKDILKEEEIEILLNNFREITFNDRMVKAIIELLYGSALRISEAGSLRLDDIDFTNESVYITDSKSDGERWKCPLSNNSVRELKKYINRIREKVISKNDIDNNFLFPRKKEKALLSLVNRKLKKECRRLGLKKITTHSFRHSCATHMLRAGAGIRDVQCMLHHKKISTTEIYTHVVKEDLKDIINKFHPGELRRSGI